MVQHPKMSPGDQMMHLAEGNPRTRSAVSNLEILDGTPDWDRLVTTYDRLSRTFPRFRQKVVVPSLPTTAPRWVVDADFDLSHHVRRVALPAPGTMRQLLDAVEVIASTPLDTARPLWTATLFEGLQGGRAATLTHLSHVVSDGVGGVAMAQALYDLTPEGTRPLMPPQPTPTELNPNELATTGIRELPGTVVRTARFAASMALSAALHPRQAVAFTKSLGAAAGAQAQPSPLLRRRGLARRTVTWQVDLTALKEAGAKHGASVNDAYVAALTLGLERYHAAKGVPVESLPLAIPVNLRKEGDSMEGNNFTGITISAPITDPDPDHPGHTARVQSVRDQIRGGRENAVDLMGLVAPVMVALPQPLLLGLEGRFTGPDVQASNIASYPVPTWFAGRKVLAQYGLGPLPGVGMMVTMVSRDGTCSVAARYDRLSFDDDELLARCLIEGFVDLVGGKGAVSAADGELGNTNPRPATTKRTSGGSRK